MTAIILLIGYCLGLLLLLRFFKVTKIWDTEIQEMTDEEKRLKQFALETYPEYPLSEALNFLYRDYQCTLKLARSLNKKKPSSSHQSIINICIRRMRILGILAAQAVCEEAEERILAAERDSSYITIPLKLKPAA